MRLILCFFVRLFLIWFISAELVWATQATALQYQPGGLIPICVSALYRACGLVDRQGNWVVQPKFSTIYENGRYWTVERESGLVGLLDADGHELIKPAFKDIGHFVNGLASATPLGGRDTLTGYIDVNGQWVIQPQFLYQRAFNGGTALVWVGPTFEKRRMALIDRHGRINHLKYDEDISERAKDGRFIVERVMKDGSLQCAGIDGAGTELLKLSAACNISIVAGGGWVVNEGDGEEGRVTRAKVLDRHGKTLLEVGGIEAWIASPNDEGLARFTPDGKRDGIVNTRTGKIILQPSDREIQDISEGRVSVGHYSDGQWNYGYIDLNGNEVIEPRYAISQSFSGGLAVLSKLPPKSHSLDTNAESTEPKPIPLVVDLNGRPLKVFDQFGAERIELSAWEDGPQSSVRRDVALVESSGRKIYTTLQGKSIVTLERSKDCDAETVKNAEGKVIWPKYPQVSCSFVGANRLPENPTDEMRAALREANQYGAEIERERAKVRTQGGGIENLLDPDRSKKQNLINAANWVEAPNTVELAGLARLKLPDAYRYLKPEDYAALRSALGQPLSELELSARMAFIQAPDSRWSAQIALIQSGHVNIHRDLSNSAEILNRLHSYSYGFFADEQRSNYGIDQHLSWEMEPQLDQKNQRLAWAINHTDFSSGNRSLTMIVSRFGRTQSLFIVVNFPGVLNMHGVAFFGDEVLALADAIEFKEGQRYAEAKATDPERVSMDELITGPPTQKSRELGKALRRMEEKKTEKVHHLLWKGGLLLLMLLTLFYSSRKTLKKTNT